jgi:hypothetical protein
MHSRIDIQKIPWPRVILIPKLGWAKMKLAYEIKLRNKVERKVIMNLGALTSFFLTVFICVNTLFPQSSAKKKIYMDIAHGQRFWNDPAGMVSGAGNNLGRVKYMTDQFVKTASSVDAELLYLKGEIKPEDLSDCDLLYIHIPSSKYTPSEIKAITQYLSNGGSLFLVMDEDYWSTLEDANANDIISPFGIQFGKESPDSAVGGYTKASLITEKSLKITYQKGRTIEGGTPFCFNKQSEEYPFGVFKKLKNGGKIVVMGDGMTSLYMTSWKGVDDYQCAEFLYDVFKWLLN